LRIIEKRNQSRPVADNLMEMAEDDQDEEERKREQLRLSQQIAERYSPEKLSKLVVGEAGRGERLDLGTRQEMERKLGGQFADVRVFKGPFAEAVTRQHRADAVTIANTGMILVREGPRSDPKTALGKALLAHELTHVKQAQRGLHFALEEGQSQEAPHEKEAEAAEAQVHAEELGQAHAAGAAHVDPEAKREQVLARVLELMEEAERLRRERLGHE
jgi:hypothetical protein